MTATNSPATEIEQRILKLLALRDHSRRELTRKLAARGFAGESVASVLDRLAMQGFVDESRLAERYVAERAGKGFGPLRIRGELREKGIAEDLVDRQIKSFRDAWPDCLAVAHKRRFGEAPPVDRVDYGRRARFLEQRGFPTDLIRRFLRRVD